MNNRLQFITIVIFGMILSALISRNGNVLLLVLPFLAYLGLGILRSPAKLDLKAHRTVTDGSTSKPARMQVEVENNGSDLHNLYLEDPQFQGHDLVDGAFSRRVAVPAGGSTELSYSFRAGRGIYSWNRVRVTASDPFGLFDSAAELPAAAELQVPPEDMVLQHLPIRPQFTLHTTGTLPARLAGPGIDFWGVREYAPGDPLRWINWRMNARNPGKFFTKEFEREEIADIGLILDARILADHRTSEGSLFEYSVRAVAALAELFLREGNRVGLLVFGKTVSSLYPGYGKRQLKQIRRTLSRACADADLSFTFLQQISTRLFPGRSLLIVLSPLGSQDVAAYRQLLALGYQVMLISPDLVQYILRSLPSDNQSRLAGRATRLERFLLLKQLMRAGVQVIDWDVEQPLRKTISTALAHAGYHREPRV